MESPTRTAMTDLGVRGHVVCVLLGLTAGLTQLVGCGCASSRERNAAPSSANPVDPASAQQVAPAAAGAGGASTTSSASVAATALADGAHARLFRPVLSHAALAAVKIAHDAGDYTRAAEAMRAAVDAIAHHGLSTAEQARWHFMLGLLWEKAGNHDAAAGAFVKASEQSGWVLRPYAMLFAAQAFVDQKNYQQAQAYATGLVDDPPVAYRAKWILANAQEGMNNAAEALRLYGSIAATNKQDSVWQQAVLRYATLVLQQPRQDTTDKQAIAWVRNVIVESSSTANIEQATLLEKQLQGRATTGAHTSWTPQMRMRQAEVLANRGRRAGALERLTQLLDEVGTDAQASGQRCAALALQAKLLGLSKTTRAKSASTYDEAIRVCDSHKGKLVGVLYAAARMQATIGNLGRALALYERVEKEFASHRLADDARWRGAKTARLMNNEPLFRSKLETMARDYPQGDMLEDGLFDLALDRMNRGAWREAMDPLSTSVRLRPKEKLHHSAGRALYFLGRSYQATGQSEQARAAWLKVIAENPLSFYTRLALSRLYAMSPDGSGMAAHFDLPLPPAATQGASQDAAQGASQDATADMDASTLEALLEREAFQRAVELLVLGLASEAREEVKRLALKTADIESWLTIGQVYQRTGHDRLAFQLWRGRTDQWASVYPQQTQLRMWQMAYPRLYYPIVEQNCVTKRVDAAVAYGIMREESAFDPKALSSANAYGLMQLIMPTAQIVAKQLQVPVSEEALLLPETNVALGCKLLSNLHAAFPGHQELAVPSYNAGAGATRRWLNERTSDDFDLWVENISYDETRGYTKRVLSTMGVYSYLYNPSSVPQSLRLPLELPAR